MSRRVSILVAILALVAGSFGTAGPVAAAAPVAVDDGVPVPIVVQEDAAAGTIDVLANDTVASDATITSVTDPANGSVEIALDGRSLTYAPDAGYAGPDTFDYTVTDVADGADSATVVIKVNAPPVAADNPRLDANCFYVPSQAFSLPEDKLSPFIAGGICNLLANDTDSDGTVVNWELVTPPQHGQVTNDLPGEIPGFSSDFSYAPDPDYFTLPGDVPGGSWLSDSFTYRAVDNDGGKSAPATVRFWIAPVNDAPTFTAGPSTVTSARGAAYSKTWATNPDPGPSEGYQTIHFNLDPSPVNDAGLFTSAPAISPGGTLSFTGAPGQIGTATFTVTAQDDGGLENYGGASDQPPAADTSDPVTLTITIENAAPVAVDDPAVPGCFINAFGGSFPIPEDWGRFDFLRSCGATANDIDPDGTIASWQVDTPPAHGSLVWLPGQLGVFSYTADPDWSTIAGDQPGGDWVSDSFTYHVIDDQGAPSNEATYRFWLAPVNDAPTFSPGGAVVHGLRGTAYDQPWATSVSPGPNESTQTVHFEVTSLDRHGNPDLFAVDPAIGADGRLTFTLATGQFGSATVTVVAKDDGGLESYPGVTVHPRDTSGPLTFDIVADNSAPSVTGDVATATEDQPAASLVDVLANDSDVDSDPLLVTARTNGAKGVVTITGGGTGISYKPNANAFGADTFTYTADDGHGGTTIGTVNVTITPVNDPPNAVNDGVPTPYKVYIRAGARAIPVLANDTYLPDASESLHIIAVTQGKHGSVAITGGGTGLTYSPIGTTTGIDVFTYTISDGHGGTDKASVQVTAAFDTTTPKAAITSLTKTTVAGRSGLKLTVTWTLSDTGSGLRSQLLQRRTDSGAWSTISLPSLSTRSASVLVPRGHLYTFRVRGVDRSGNVGLFAIRSVRI